MSAKRPILARLGPGLLYAGAAVGVSHLVQSTKAGALFGYGLIWAVLAANILKYPFFEFGPRYAAATGKSLIYGYRMLGYFPLAIFTLMTLLTMFIIQAAITIVTAGLALHITGSSMDGWVMGAIILAICVALLVIGRYRFLDRMMKIVIILLSVTTVVCVAVGYGNGATVVADGPSFVFSNAEHIGFLIALMGWMPAPLDISVWHSVWSTADNEEKKERTSMKDALFDFKIGYWGTLVLALCFVVLGALSLYGGTEPIDETHVGFAAQLIQMYSDIFAEGGTSGVFANIMYVIVAIAALCTMFSTTLTCLDAFPRVLTPSTQLLTDRFKGKQKERQLYWFWISLVSVGAIGLLVYLKYTDQPMGNLVKFITILSFILAPIIALLNYLAVTSSHMPEEHRPGLLLRIMSLFGIVFLVGFGVWYLSTLF